MQTKTTRKSISLLLSLVLMLSMSVTANAATGATVEFTFPERYYETTEGVTIDIYKGVPTHTYYGLDALIEDGTLVLIGGDAGKTPCTITEPGNYSYHIYGDDYYNMVKLFIVTEEQIASGKITLSAVGGNLAGNGFEPTTIPPLAYDGFKVYTADATIVEWTDQLMEGALNVSDQGYMTPAFDGTGTYLQATTQDEMMAFLKDRDAKSDEMYLYSYGTTPNYNYDMPVAIFTQTDLSGYTDLKSAAAAVAGNGKLNFWVQAQIHPNETAAGEAALVLIDDMINDSAVSAYLDKVNVIIIPRVNPDGSYLYTRETYGGFDMNRDHLALKAKELAYLHTAYRYFMPEVAIDLHEMMWYGTAAQTDYMSKADDVQVTPATSLNNDSAVTDFALEMTGNAFSSLREAELRPYHYGTTVNNPIGRAYYGLYGSLSFLSETPGISGAKLGLERRVLSHETTVLSLLDTAAVNAERCQKLVAAARADIVNKGDVFGEADDVLVLQHGKSGKTVTDYLGLREQYKLDGTLYSSKEVTLELEDTVVRGRQRPTAYVLPADLANIQNILYIFDNQGIEYYKLDAGSSAALKQYYYVGEYTYNEKKLGFTAELRDAASVTFQNGAYVIPMDQVGANIAAMLLEPDVNDSNGYDGTLVQYKQIAFDETTKNFPIYRYEGNDPRATLVNNAPAPVTPGQTPAEPTVPAQDKTYTVVAGDCLWNIAYKMYGSGSKFGLIAEANKLSAPYTIYVGQVLVIPQAK